MRVYDLCVYYMTGAPEGSPKVVLCGFYGLCQNCVNVTVLSVSKPVDLVHILLQFLFVMVSEFQLFIMYLN